MKMSELQELLDTERARLRWFDFVHYNNRYMLEIIRQRKEIVETIRSLELHVNLKQDLLGE